MENQTRNKPTISITLSLEVKEKLEKLSKKLGVNRSALISLAINELYEKNK